MSRKAILHILVMSMAACMTACAQPGTAKYPTGYDRTETHGDIYAPRETIWKNGSPVDKFIKNHKSDKGQTGPKVNE